MSARRLKVRDQRHLDSLPGAPSTTPPAASFSPPPARARASLVTAVMANSVEGPTPQPSKQPAGPEIEAAAAKEERRPSEPVPKKRRLLQATEAEQSAGVQGDPEDILAQVISAVGIDSNLVESEVEELPPAHHAEGMVGLQYLKEVRSLPPGMSLSPRIRAPDPRARPAYPPPYHGPLEGPYTVRELRHPYPYALRPHELIAHQGPPPPYRPVNAFRPRHYLRPSLPPSQTITRLSMVRPPEHLPHQHSSPGVPRHFRPPPLHTSPPDTPSEVHHVLAAPSHPSLQGTNSENPSRFYPSGPLGRPELKNSLPPHVREVYVPVHQLPGAPYRHLRPRVPEGLTRLTYDPRVDPGRELGPHQVVVASHFPHTGPLPPRPLYSPERHRSTDPTWRPQALGEGALRSPRRIIEPSSPCVELIPIGPRRTSGASPSTADERHGSDPNNHPAGTSLPASKSQTEGPDGRRQSAPVLSVHPLRPPLVQRSFSSDVPFGQPEPSPVSTEARRSSDPVVANITASTEVEGCEQVSGEKNSKTEETCDEDTRPSSTNSDVTIEKVVLVNPGSGGVLPHIEKSVPCRNASKVVSNTGPPAVGSGTSEAASRRRRPPTRNESDEEPRSGQVSLCTEEDKVMPLTVKPVFPSDGDHAPGSDLNTCRPASEPPLSFMPSQVTGRRPASLPAPDVVPQPCPRSDVRVVSEDAVFMERLQLVLSDLLSVPEATQLQELSCSPARLLSTLVRRCGVQPSTNPNLQKRLREDFKTMVQLCMPPALIQDFGWESCTSEQILTQLLRLSHNGEDVDRRSSLSSYVPVDETLEDDVFSPATPHSPLQTLHLSQTLPSPQSSQPSHPPSSSSQPSRPPPQTPQPSNPPPSSSQPSNPPKQASQPSNPPPQTSQPSLSPPSSSQPSCPPPQTSQPSQPPPSSSQSFHFPPQTSEASHFPPSSSQPSRPQPQTSQPSHPSPQTSQPSHSHSSPQPSHPSAQTSQSSPSLQTSQLSQPPPSPQPSHPPPLTSQLSHPPPQISQPCLPPPLSSQPSQSPPQTSHSSRCPPPQTSQPSHLLSSSQLSHLPPSSQPSHPPPSPQPADPPPQTSQPPPSSSHPSHPPSQTSQPSYPPLSSSQSLHPTPQTSKSCLPHLRNLQPSQTHPQTSQPPQCPPLPSRTHPEIPKPTQSTHPSLQSSQASLHPPPSSQSVSQVSKPAQNPPQVVQTSQHSPRKSQPSQPSTQTPQPSHFLPPSSQSSLQASKPSQNLPHNIHPSQPSPPASNPPHPSSPSSQPAQIRQLVSRPSPLPLPPSEPSYLSSSPSHPTHLPPSPSQLYHLPPSSHPSHPPPLKSQPLLHTSHPLSRLPSPSSQPSHLPPPSHVTTPISWPSHLPSLTSLSPRFPLPNSQSYLTQSSSLSPSRASHPTHLPGSASQPSHLQPPLSLPTHLPSSPSQPTQPSPHISPISSATHLSPPSSRPSQPPPHASPTSHSSPPSSRPSNLPSSSHPSTPFTTSSPPTHPPSPSSHPSTQLPSTSHNPSPSRSSHFPSHASQAAHLIPHVSHSTHIPSHTPLLSPHYPKKVDEFSYSQLQHYLQSAPRPRFAPHPYSTIAHHPQPPPPPHHHAGSRKDVPVPPPPGKDTVILQNHEHHPPHPPPQHHHSSPSHVRYAMEKWIGNDGVVRPVAYTSTNGQASPGSTSLPT